ncbi:MAG: CusA/CzcA family heavy metal efflux RND transporter [Myxococcota bacterium]|nr:CusA/CzcA family heavy metal efflux RND transporter [Myxococcota bacterium]
MLFDRTIRWSLAHRGVVCVAWLVLAVIGIISFLRLPLDAFPDTTPVQVQINTTAAALSPEEIERQITWPVEQALSGLPELAEVRSLSRFGISQVTLVFDDDASIWRSRQVVAERLSTVALPEGVERPQLGPLATGLGEVFHYLVQGEGHSLDALRAAQDWILAPQLRAVPGVAEVNSWGGDERRIEVLVSPETLVRYGLTLDDLVSALSTDNRNVGGGSIDRAGESTLVQGVGRFATLDDVRQVVVTAREGVPVVIGDLAEVQRGREIRRGAVTAGGEGETVLGLGFMLLGENSAVVTERLELRLNEAAAALPDGITATPVYQRTWLIEQVLDTVRENLFEGALLVIAVLFAFLGSWRAGLVVATTIPLSMAFASSFMLQFGIAGSLMSLGAIDFGLVVDSSIVQVENAIRRLGERPDDDRLTVVGDAALEVRKPTMFGELIILVVYLPVLALEGTEGQLFRPMALTVIFALIGSMLASLTLVPVLTSLLIRSRGHREVALVRLSTRLYRPLLRFALDAPGIVLAVALLLMLNAGFLATRLGTAFIPRLSEGAVVINTVRLASVSLDESVRYGTQIERVILSTFPDEVADIWTRTGSAALATDPMGIELSDVFISLTPRELWKRADSQAELVAAMEQELSALPGMNMVFTQPIEMRVNEMVAGVRSDLGVKVFGDDLTQMRTLALQIEDIIGSVAGAADVSVEQVTGLPVLRATVDRSVTARHGLSAAGVLQFVESIGGVEVGELLEGERRFPIAVRLSEDSRRDPEQISTLLVTGADGTRLPLGTLARIERTDGPGAIQREWGRRRLVVQSNVRGRDLGSFVAEVQARISAELILPDGWFVRYGGQFEHYERARKRLLIVVPMALSLIALLLYTTYGRAVDALRVFTGVPFAAIGGITALWLLGLPFSVSAAVGFVALSGVSVLADMLLVSTIRRNRDEGLPLREAVEQAAIARLRPVLMTGLVAALGFAPMAFNTGIGAEVQRPLAAVVIGGLLSSTVLTLLVLPVLYTITGRAR